MKIAVRVRRGAFVSAFAAGLVAMSGVVLAEDAFVASPVGVLHYVINPTGTPTLVETITDPDIKRPYGLGRRLNGALVVGNTDTCFVCGTGGIVSFTKASCGQPGVKAGSVTTGFNTPHALTIVGDYAYLLDSFNARIKTFRFNTAGAPVLVSNTSAGVLPTDVRGITVHPGLGEILVSTCCGSNNVSRFRIQADGSLSPIGSFSGNGISNPHQMVVSPSGELFVSNANGNSVSRFKFGPTGTVIPNGTISGNNISTPLGVGMSPWGELFVANSGNNSVSRFTFDGSGNAVANGSFGTPNTADHIIFASQLPPAFLGPAAQQGCPGGSVNIGIIGGAPIDTAAFATFVWQVYDPATLTWKNLADGPAPAPGTATVVGTNTPTLQLFDLTPADAAKYRVIVDAGCGTVTSTESVLTIKACDYSCVADYDGSGGTPDSTDIAAFFLDWLTGAECADADCSGGTPDSSDINAFFGPWLAGGC
jgi:hypothetical protein